MRRIPDADVWRIYAATLIVGIAYGISISLTAIHLDALGFGKAAIGGLAVWFALGLVALAIPAGALIRRFSAKRVLVAALLGYAATVAWFPWLDSRLGLASVRLADGACSVAVWVSCETLLLSRAAPEHKAFTMGLYATALAIGYVAGPVLASAIVLGAPRWVAFGVAGGLALLAAGYVAARVGRDPLALGAGSSSAVASAPASIGPLLWKIKNSCFATFAYGYFQAAVVLFLPLYLTESKGITPSQTMLIPAFFAAGMLLFSNVIGRAGDRFGCLLTMRFLAGIGVAMILGFVYLDSYALMCCAVFVAGATLATISPVSLALQGLQCGPAEYGRATGLYNTFYAAGILLGPPCAGQLFERAGGELMLFHLALLWAAFIGFSAVFARDDPRARGGLPASISSA